MSEYKKIQARISELQELIALNDSDMRYLRELNAKYLLEADELSELIDGFDERDWI